jgi:DNA-binding beta-propeller fold protein YncE
MTAVRSSLTGAGLASLLSVFALAGLGCSDDSANSPTACDQTIPGNICTIAGSLELASENAASGYAGDDGPARDALFSLPQDTLTADDGTVYILDWNNHRIRKLVDGVIRHVAGRGELGGTLDDPANGDFNHPTGILFTPDQSRMVVAAWHNSKVRTLDLATGEIVDTCGDGRRAYWGDEGPAITASLDLPSSLAWDQQGNLIILDQANQVIRYIDPAGIIHPLYGRCVIDAPAPTGPGACPEGQAPTACAAMGGSPSGKSTCGDPAVTCTSACTPGFNGDDVPAANMRMGQPFGQSADPGGRILFDPEGRLYMADAGNSIIRRIDSDGMVHRVAGIAPVDGTPQRGYSGDGGPATEALLNNPVDLALAEDGTLYFTDVYNHCVRAIDPDGIISTVVGVCGESGTSGDGGPATAARLKRPYGLELTPTALHISDTGNNIIRSVRR